RGFAGQAVPALGRLKSAPPGVRHIHLGYAPDWDSVASLFEEIKGTISLDAGWHEDWLSDPRALEALPQADIFFPNESEAARITGESNPERILQRFRDAGLRCVVLKLGANGAALLHDGKMYFEPPLHITPVDTTGAGDCFDAGFLHAWLNAEPPEACLRTANICGALSCRQYGGIAGFPTREELSCLK